MMITRVTSEATNVNRLFTWVNKNWKIKKFDYINKMYLIFNYYFLIYRLNIKLFKRLLSQRNTVKCRHFMFES